MSTLELQYEIQQTLEPNIETGDSVIKLKFILEGRHTATASIALSTLREMENAGYDRESVTNTLRHSLIEYTKHNLRKVTIQNLSETPPDSLCYKADYIYRIQNAITTGMIWYKVETGEVGPESAPVHVKNMMRAFVHRILNKEMNQDAQFTEMSIAGVHP